MAAMGVSSHAPVRGHRAILSGGAQQPQGFKSCPREGASDEIKTASKKGEVSSHAPVRGHLNNVGVAANVKLVSSHAPVRGHPLLGLRGVAGVEEFQVMPP